MKIRPLHDFIVVRRIDQDNPRRRSLSPGSGPKKLEGQVRALGRGRQPDPGTQACLDLRIGDRVLFDAGAGRGTTLAGDDYLMMRESDILAILDSGGPTYPKAEQ